MSIETQEPVPLPLGITDQDGRTGYFAAGLETIEAVNLADGSLLWQTDALLRPLIAFEQRLAAQAASVPRKANTLRIVLLNVKRNGKQILASDPALLPDWVDCLASEPEIFQYRVRLEGREMVLAWEAHRRYSGGAPPPRQVVEQAARDASGEVRVDLETGRIKAEAVPLWISGATLREANSDPPSPDVIWHTEPWRIGDRLAALMMKEEGLGQSLYLATWSPDSTATGAKLVELARGTGMAPSLSPDGKYVLVEPDEPEPGPRGPQRPWWIFETTTGRRIATVPHEEGAREPCIVVPRLYYVVREPARSSPGKAVGTVLRVRDLGSGELLWERRLGLPGTDKAPDLPRKAGSSEP